MKRTMLLLAAMAAICLCLVAGCSSSGNPSNSSSGSSSGNAPVEYANVTFKAFSMDVPAKWAEPFREAELKNNTVQLQSDGASDPEAFMIVSHFSVPNTSMSAREMLGMKSATGDDMEPIDVDGTECGISPSFATNYHRSEVLFYTPDDATQIRVTFSYKDSAKETWEGYADEFYKSIRFN